MGASAEEFVLRRRRLSPAYKKLEAKYGRDQHMFDDVLAQTGFYSKRHGAKFDESYWKAYDESMGLEEADMDSNMEEDIDEARLMEDDAPRVPRKPRVTRKRAPSGSSSSRSAAGLTRKQKRAANRAAWRAGERW